MAFQKPSPEVIEQLALDLGGLEIEGDAAQRAISPDEARARSEAARAVLEAISGEGAPDWLAEYQQLRSAGWSWRVAAYIAWSASPRKTRWPATQNELASEVLGLTSDRAIATWRRKNPTIDETISLLQAAPLWEHRADILAALVASATDPDHRSHPDRRLALEMLGDYTPRSTMKVERSEVEDLSELSEEDLAQIIRRAGDELGTRGEGHE